jgi:Family of unknown function (DUF6886)
MEYPEYLLARDPAPPYDGEGPFALWHFSEDPSWACRLYAYRLPAGAFRPHEVVGYWVAEEQVEADDQLAIDDLAGRHADAGIELRILAAAGCGTDFPGTPGIRQTSRGSTVWRWSR